MTTTKAKAAGAASHVRPYVERALRDEELRQNVKEAYVSARALYDQLLARNNVTNVATKLVSDDDVQTELRNVVAQIRSAASRVHAEQEKQKAERSARTTFLVVVGVAVGLLINPVTGPSLRGWLKRKIFGGGDSFTYHEGNGTHLK
jgi:hypothetical protein